MSQIPEKVCALRSLTDRECGIVRGGRVGGLVKISKTNSREAGVGGCGWNRGRVGKMKIVIAKGRVGFLIFNYFFLSFSTN